MRSHFFLIWKSNWVLDLRDLFCAELWRCASSKTRSRAFWGFFSLGGVHIARAVTNPCESAVGERMRARVEHPPRKPPGSGSNLRPSCCECRTELLQHRAARLHAPNVTNSNYTVVLLCKNTKTRCRFILVIGMHMAALSRHKLTKPPSSGNKTFIQSPYGCFMLLKVLFPYITCGTRLIAGNCSGSPCI